MTTNSQTVYVVRDASGEYIGEGGRRTPASDEAYEFETADIARGNCARATDRVLSREIDEP